MAMSNYVCDECREYRGHTLSCSLYEPGPLDAIAREAVALLAESSPEPRRDWFDRKAALLDKARDAGLLPAEEA